MQNNTKYTFTQRYGMEGAGDFVNEYLTEEDIAENKIRRKAYIEDCYDKGIYGI